MRLGRNGVGDFRKHPFFFGLEWDSLRDSVPPFTPDFEGATDTCNFDMVEDGLTAMVSGGGVGTCDPSSAEGTPHLRHNTEVRRVPSSWGPEITASPEPLLFGGQVLGSQQ